MTGTGGIITGVVGGVTGFDGAGITTGTVGTTGALIGAGITTGAVGVVVAADAVPTSAKSANAAVMVFVITFISCVC